MENEAHVSPRPVLLDEPSFSTAPIGSIASIAQVSNGATSSGTIRSRPGVTPPEAERTGVFTSLVREDGDIAGLVAYSIYKQNKLDWLQAFEAAKGRVPVEAEVSAYIIGESTPRRLATYRHLAEATLSGNGPEPSGAHGRSPVARDKTIVAGFSLRSSALAAICAALAIAVIVAFWLAAHYTLTAR